MADDSKNWNVHNYKAHCLYYVAEQYAWGEESPDGSDCSEILRAWFRLEYTANDFYHRLFIHEAGEIGAVFLVDDQDFAYHVMPWVGDNVVIDAQSPRIILRPWTGNGKLLFI